jgi:putative tryptophan/tyrosine transport system substrate-binding protein
MPPTRRRLLQLAGSLAGVAWLGALAQPRPSLPRVAYVYMFDDGPSAPYIEAFRERMTQLGWVEGRNYLAQYSGAGGSPAKLDELMQSLVRERVDVIVAVCTPEAHAALKFTTTIPVVLAATGDPVMAGLVQSLARPGGNVTGVSSLSLPLSAKRVALLKEAVPTLNQATVLWSPARRDNEPEVKIMQDAGLRLGVRLTSAPVRSRDELAIQLEALGWDRTQALMNAGDYLVTSERQAIVGRANALRLPALYEDRVFVEAGGLMSYGPNLRTQHRRAADYVDQILKGAKPQDMPIQQPTHFELVLNRTTARSIGVVFPRSLLLQAEEVIG